MLDSSYSSTTSYNEAAKKLNSSSIATTVQSSFQHAGDSEAIAGSQTTGVNKSRALLLALIAIAAGSMGGLAYALASRQENNVFEESTEEQGSQVVHLVHARSESLLHAVGSFATMISSYAIDTNTEWPWIHVQNFDLKASESNAASKAQQIAYAPLVPAKHHKSWKEFSQEIKTGILEPKLTLDIVPLEGYEKNDLALTEYYAPIWQQTPLNPNIINTDLLTHPVFRQVYENMMETGEASLSPVTELGWLTGQSQLQADDGDTTTTPPQSFVLHPILSSLQQQEGNNDDDKQVVGVVVAIISWQDFLADILNDSNTMLVVLQNTCDADQAAHTFELRGPATTYLGAKDLHRAQFDSLKVSTNFVPEEASLQGGSCEYSLYIYPSSQEGYSTHSPVVVTLVVISVFLLLAVAFVLYDWQVRRRHQVVLRAATHTSRIVNAFFPENIRDRLLKDEEGALDVSSSMRSSKGRYTGAPKAHIKNFLDEDYEDSEDTENAGVCYSTKPIADLFPRVTIMFADVVGFTAWSSERAPPQVFTLLESIFAAFDHIAERRRVFKVETVGDCYVAAVGLPEPRSDHAIVMARFAQDCLRRMNDLTKKLEVILGPGTANLSLRIGLHSGPVTAGVLRGHKSRFQLFGDTMNTTARIESTGAPNRIHLSQETAHLLKKAGKEHWLKERSDIVNAKGKGSLNTYWLEFQNTASEQCSIVSSTECSQSLNHLSPHLDAFPPGNLRAPNSKEQRLVNWCVDVVLGLLRELTARREALDLDNPNRRPADTEQRLDELEAFGLHSSGTVLDEVKEIVMLPNFNEIADRFQRDPDLVELPLKVEEQVRHYVQTIASLYRKNSFHNFEHAAHVTMSTVKLLSRIVAPDLSHLEEDAGDKHLHDHTYGITTDPLTRFACVFSALVHDLDHPGVPNSQLINENVPMAKAYKNKSIAEQNSVDMAWSLLMDDDQYKDFRRIIYSTVSGFNRFRQLVVNMVMATDVMDRDLKALRNGRWDKAFKEDNEESEQEGINRKATIVIEHLIQASDVSHTMQHWHVYLRWNERLFDEMYEAYRSGRAEKDPSEFWYKGEMAFFDFYILPLTSKLKKCGVFGVSSDEYMNYAEKNRREWELRGQEMVSSYMEKHMTCQAREKLGRVDEV